MPITPAVGTTIILRFRAEPGQAGNLRVRVYTQNRATLLLTLTTDITEEIAGSGSYKCPLIDKVGYWYVLVNLIDTGEITSDGFANEGYPEVVDIPANLIGGSLAADVIAGLSAIEPKLVSAFDPRKKLIKITRANDLNVTSGTHVDIPINLPVGVNGASCTVKFGAKRKDSYPDKINATVSLVQVVGRWVIRLQLTKTQTSVSAGDYDWDALVIETANSREVTVISGQLEVRQNLATSV